jgi:putative endonuclease
LCRYGEIDLIVCDKKYLVFVEVKLRRSAAFAEARDFVDYRKQERIRTTASIYLAEHETNLQPRFDVIEIYAPEGMETARPEINHLEDAFQ